MIMQWIKVIFRKLFRIFHPQNIIVLESNPDLSDNTFALYQTLLKHKVNRKYHIVWLVNDAKQYEQGKPFHVYYENFFPEGARENFARQKLIASARFIINCNKPIEKIHKETVSVDLCHGTILKDVSNISMIDSTCDYVAYPSDFFRLIFAEQLHLSEEKLICLGYPRNDFMLNSRLDLAKLFVGTPSEKYVIWMPTFRQHKNGRVDSQYVFPLGIPVLQSMEQLYELNQLLRELHVKLLLKPHPAQDISIIHAQSLSNFIVLYDDDLLKKNIQLYELLGKMDAMITDYSSVYYDFLLTDRPVAITVDDMESYCETNGFAYDNVMEMLAGEHISDFSGLLTFFRDLAQGRDNKFEQREKIKKLSNRFLDAGSSERFYQFLLSKGL